MGSYCGNQYGVSNPQDDPLNYNHSDRFVCGASGRIEAVGWGTIGIVEVGLDVVRAR